jgi:hypothetical protein
MQNHRRRKGVRPRDVYKRASLCTTSEKIEGEGKVVSQLGYLGSRSARN